MVVVSIFFILKIIEGHVSILNTGAAIHCNVHDVGCGGRTILFFFQKIGDVFYLITFTTTIATISKIE